MADVTGTPVPTGGSPFDVPGDLREIADHFGDEEFFSVATATALPASDNWRGRLLMARDTGVLYRCLALPGTWKAVTEVVGTMTAATNYTILSTSHLRKDGDGFVSGVLVVQKNADIVHGNPIATMPAGFRPSTDVTVRDTTYKPGFSNGSGDFVIFAAGGVSVYTPNPGSTHALLRIYFKAA